MTIQIVKMEYFAEDLRQLSRDLPELKADAMRDTIMHCGVLEEIGQRIPQSDRYRYAYRYKAIDTKDWLASGKGLKRGWRSKFSDSQLARLDEYGQQRLFKSIFGGSDKPTIDGLDVSVGEKTVRYTIGSNLPYAKKMHEATHITDDWSATVTGIGAKRGRGWSKKGTGAKFITGPVAEYKDVIHEDLQDKLRDRLEEAMS